MMEKSTVLERKSNGGSQNTLSDDVFTRLTEDIVSGKIPQGSKIIETNLAQTYGTSRGPLREAIRRLESTQLINRTPHAGARVVTLNQEMMAEIYVTREALEGMSARLVAERRDPKVIEYLWSIFAMHELVLKENHGKTYFNQEGDLDLHHQLAVASGNTWIVDFLTNRLYQILRMCRYQSSSIESRPDEALAEHKAVLEAIERGDAELAELLMRRHISRSWELVKDYLV